MHTIIISHQMVVIFWSTQKITKFFAHYDSIAKKLTSEAAVSAPLHIQWFIRLMPIDALTKTSCLTKLSEIRKSESSLYL